MTSTTETQRKTLTASVRQSIYGIVAAIVPLLVLVGVISESVGGNILAIAASVIATAGAVLALKNLSPDPVVAEEVTPE